MKVNILIVKKQPMFPFFSKFQMALMKNLEKKQNFGCQNLATRFAIEFFEF